MTTITLLGQPQSTNNIYRSVCFGKRPSVYMDKEAKLLKLDYAKQAMVFWRKLPLEEKDICISIRLYFGDRRERDWDNFHKLSMDSLSGIVWKDDSQISKAVVEKFYDKLNPRIEIDVLNY